VKKRLGPSDRLYPMPCPLVVGGTAEEVDTLAVAWIGIAAGTPPSVSMALRDTRHTLKLIRASGEFTVNIPSTRWPPSSTTAASRAGRAPTSSPRPDSPWPGACREHPHHRRVPVQPRVPRDSRDRHRALHARRGRDRRVSRRGGRAGRDRREGRCRPARPARLHRRLAGVPRPRPGRRQGILGRQRDLCRGGPVS
jgi:hypothetical protein